MSAKIPYWKTMLKGQLNSSDEALFFTSLFMQKAASLSQSDFLAQLLVAFCHISVK